MPSIKTIKPAGGGDFTSLSTWEDYADGQASADQWAECYSGGNLGAVTLSGWSSTSSAGAYPKIYAAKKHRHGGEVDAGAYISASSPISVSIKYTQIDGLRIQGITNSNKAVDFSPSSTAADCRIDNCIVHGTFQWGILIGQSSSGVTSSNYVTNNIVIIDGTANTNPIGIYAYGTDASGGTTNMYIYNNSLYVANPGSLNSYGIRFANTASCILNISVENNIVIGPVNTDGSSITYGYTQITFDSGTKMFNNNISSDGTADNFGGTGHQLKASASEIWKDAPNNNFNIPLSSIALNSGKTLSAVTTDMFGTSRPQSDYYDIGAIERSYKIPIQYGVPPAFELPTSLVSSHEYIADSLIDGPTGQDCQLIYPVTKNAVCINCVFSPRQKRSSNIYKAGGPVPFENHTTCPWCGGEGRSSRAVKETIRLRVYWTQKDWSIFGPVENPESYAMVIGYMEHLPKLEKADRILLNKELVQYRKWIFERKGEAVPWGLGQDRYFAQMLKRSGGG